MPSDSSAYAVGSQTSAGGLGLVTVPAVVGVGGRVVPDVPFPLVGLLIG